MTNDFDGDLFELWCKLYVCYAIQERRRLCNSIVDCESSKFQELIDKPNQLDKNTFRNNIAGLLDKTEKTETDYLNAYSYLKFLEDQFWQKPRPNHLSGLIESSLNDTRYVLTYLNEHPILKAIPKPDRFRLKSEIGTNGLLKFRNSWNAIPDKSIELDFCRSEVFDCFDDPSKENIRIGLSPFANQDDMNWEHSNNHGGLALDKRTPFWCKDAKDEKELLDRVSNVLVEAQNHNVHILLFPELVMTKYLQDFISQWLRTNNTSKPTIRLIIAGTRHIICNDNPINYSNCCTVFNYVGTIEWEQKKLEPFTLTLEQTKIFFPEIEPKSIAFEPTDLSKCIAIRQTALGRIATPICLDFLSKNLLSLIPIDVFLVPAMSSSFRNFIHCSENYGEEFGSATFVCNIQSKDALLAYRPMKTNNGRLQINNINTYLFTVDVDI